MTTEKSTSTINIWRPSLFIKIGVTLNIIFCSFLSILVLTLPITIPAIVFNALLLVPVTSDKPKSFLTKIIPTTLTIFLAVLLAVVVLFAVTSLEGALNWVVTFINKYILFWGTEPNLDAIDISYWLDIYMIIIIALGSTGSALIIVGQYHKRELGLIEKSK